MASVGSNPAIPAPASTLLSGSLITRIEPAQGLFHIPFAELWAYRELLYYMAWREVKIRYKQTAIGVIWVVMQPLLTMLVATIFFGRLAKLPSQGLPYSVFCFAAIVPWGYFANALTNITNVVVENQRVITKVYFPRLILPFSAAVQHRSHRPVNFHLCAWHQTYFCNFAVALFSLARHSYRSRRGPLVICP
jgi:ABC-type polysaccharide/polyol phosphate export permease